MGIVNNRTSLTSRAITALSPWNETRYTYSVLQINLGNNFISSLEIVSALNSFNTAYNQYHFNYINCHEQYNPKVFFGTIQSVGLQWNFDAQNTGKWTHTGMQKSGSWL